MAMTLRLTSEQSEELEVIQKRLGTNTASATLKKMITGHSNLVQQLSIETRRANEAKEELAAIKAELQDYLGAKKALAERIKEA